MDKGLHFSKDMVIVSTSNESNKFIQVTQSAIYLKQIN